MLRFKRGGFSTYDLGGWYPGRDNEKLLRVNRFKEEFGGVVVTLFNFIRPITAGGYVYFIARSVKVALSSLMNPLQAKWETAGKE
jgi:lipid II:glycine glycyltransferase (peptidoglycan interpeptide bridge formation enzyme)